MVNFSGNSVTDRTPKGRFDFYRGVISTTTEETIDIEQLFDSHGAFIARVIERLTGAGPHVDDLLQETFIIAFQKADRFDGTRAEAPSWLYGIAANLCRRHGRSLRRAGRFVSRYTQHAKLLETFEGPDRAMVRKEDIQTVHRAIQKLPFKQREVFILFEIEGMDGRDIGQLLNLKEGTVWTRLHYARKSFASSVRKMVAYNDKRNT